METFMGGAMMIETALLSFLLALWISWLGMRGIFRLMPATVCSAHVRAGISNSKRFPPEDGRDTARID